MKESRLLYGARIRPMPFKRDFIRLRSLKPERPLQYLSMDIKYVYVHGTGRNILLLTVIDIYSRKVLIYLLLAITLKPLAHICQSILIYRSLHCSLIRDEKPQSWINENRQTSIVERPPPANSMQPHSRHPPT
jgi:hypothetical protein